MQHNNGQDYASLNATRSADYIIAGAGCAGLSLAVHMIASGKFRDKQILLIDKDPKRANDRTWCFWQEQAGLFEDIICKRWQRLWFHGNQFSKELNIHPYHYKMIRGIDFYEYAFSKIRKQPNFSFLQENVEEVFSNDEGTGVIVNGEKIGGEFVFNSILFHKPRLTAKQYWLLQHFKGWIVETAKPAFDPEIATLMDFRTGQHAGTAFCYVLPFSPNKALIEYTLFSPQVLKDDEYDLGLQIYISKELKLPEYRILDEEKGVIPMTNFNFSPGKNSIVNLGTAGGQTKGSSGYSFNFIQKHSAAIVEQLVKTGKPFIAGGEKRFQFYDSVLLNILYKKRLEGKDVFTDLFKKNPSQRVLKFLDNESSLREELGIISTLPTLPFMRAALQQIF